MSNQEKSAEPEKYGVIEFLLEQSHPIQPLHVEVADRPWLITRNKTELTAEERKREILVKMINENHSKLGKTLEKG